LSGQPFQAAVTVCVVAGLQLGTIDADGFSLGWALVLAHPLYRAVRCAPIAIFVIAVVALFTRFGDVVAAAIRDLF
jgi:hypothetical protein